MRKLFAVAMGSWAAIAGFASAANASATVDLIWVASSTDTTSHVSVSSNITLQVILTAGPNGSLGNGVSVDYSDVLGKLVVTGYVTTPTAPKMAFSVGSTVDTGSRIENINATSLPVGGAGIGLAAGVSAQLGTVTFHKSVHINGTFEIQSDANGPVDDVLDLQGDVITGTTTFNSAFLINGMPTPTPSPTPAPTPTPMPTPTPAPDADGDGIPDAIDNCPFVWNNTQDNNDDLTAGDACQCGDVDSDGDVDGVDVQIAREYILGRNPLSGSFDPDRCNVIGTSDCAIDDVFVLQRQAQGLPVDLQNVCDVYVGP
jgi:hypothetical protein